MPVMKRIHGKAYRIYEDLMGTPPNKHCPVKRDPRISERDIQNTLQALGMSGGSRELANQNNLALPSSQDIPSGML